MNIYAFPPVATVIDAVYAFITAIAGVLEPLAGTASAALAVVLLTVLVRAALIPVGVSQVRADITRRRLAPRIAELQRRYKKNPELLQRKTMELYTAEKASPFAGCLPLLVQIPVVGLIYAIFTQVSINGHPNALLEHELFGVRLGSSLVQLAGGGALTPSAGILFACIMAVIAVVAQVSRRLLAQPPASSTTDTGEPSAPGMPNLAGLTRVLSFTPFVTAIVAAFVPLAAAIYLLVTVSWTLGERLVLRRVLGARQVSPGASPEPA